MKPELRMMFDTAESQRRGLLADEIAYLISNAPRGSERRAEILALINGGKASTEEGRAALRTLVEDSGNQSATPESLAPENEGPTLEERQAETRSFAQKLGIAALPSTKAEQGDSFRGLLPSYAEYRALQSSTPADGGFLVPKATAKTYFDKLRADSAFLNGLPASNIIQFDTAELTLPGIASSSTPGYVDENGQIPEGSMTFTGVTLSAKAIKELRYAPNELLADSAVDLRNALAADMLSSAASRIDVDAFGGSGTNPVKGIIGQGVTTTLGAGKLPSFDDLADAITRVRMANGKPSVVFVSPDVEASLMKEKAATAGTYQAGAPTGTPLTTVWGLPILVSANVGTKTAIVCDASRIFFGIRSQAYINASEDFRFDRDQVTYRIVVRVAGTSVAEASSVQVIKGS
ncbi:phage major capsid protein [Streptomyces coffeae]|uniref:Phage major capsid protein n=1 Tax=Streptomyces coffeae TaxID=621382 RepID=A0ABS1NG91_9ACTN|nr:phage major capsid protein [Streptomyces coffeae]MBL1099132.1 phage major capsid protein [Streptomyces coffeae]